MAYPCIQAKWLKDALISTLTWVGGGGVEHLIDTCIMHTKPENLKQFYGH